MEMGIRVVHEDVELVQQAESGVNRGGCESRAWVGGRGVNGGWAGCDRGGGLILRYVSTMKTSNSSSTGNLAK